ncbi:MAG TPA: hypothetical protein VHU83_01050 [Bryobacteraceae bacterium]|nr:hypothetical protein [Bryobacteraceae bacterium]
MRYCCAVALVFAVAAGAEDISPRVGLIEIYGAHKTPVQKIKAAVGANPGDPMPSRDGIEDRVGKLPGVLAARVEAACCDQRKMILYVGVEEKDAPHFDFHPTPTGDLTLAPGLEDKYREFLEAVAGSIRGRNADEDLTNGYSLMADPECRNLQSDFIPLVTRDLTMIDRVVRESSDPEQRAAAAYLIQYGPRTAHSSKFIVDALQYALRDQDETVRENAMRALHAVAVGGKLHPEQQVDIEPTWFVELLNSVVWSDRHNATLALVNLTDTGNTETLALIRQRALASVIEMARWHDLQHALPAFILAGRLAGLSESEIQAAWLSGSREPVLEQALHPNKKHREASKKQPGNASAAQRAPTWHFLASVDQAPLGCQARKPA